VQVQSRSRLGLTVNEDGLSFQNSTTPTCPLCREGIPDMAQSIIQEVIKLVSAAQKEDVSESFVQQQCTRALEKMELLNEIEAAEADVTGKRRYQLQIKYFQLQIHLSLKEYSEALELAKESEEEMWLAVKTNGLLIVSSTSSNHSPGMDLATMNVKKSLTKLKPYKFSLTLHLRIM